MNNINYKYNPETLEYEEVKLTLWDRTKKLSYYLVASVVFSFLILTVAFYNIRNYIQKEAAKENQSLRQEISSFNKNSHILVRE